MLIDKRLGRIEGLILTTAMVTYIGSMVISALKNRTEDIGCKERPLPISVLYIAGGLAAVITGGNLTVNSASAIALSLGVSQNFIGLTIVAIGTSLPELVTSIVAARKGDSGLALGNAIGSNLFNILFILGFSAIISPLHVKGESIIDCTVLIISAIALLIMAGTKRKMSKKEGITCLILYTAYMIYLFIR